VEEEALAGTKKNCAREGRTIVWAHWKQHEMPNFCPKDFAELSAFARAKLKRTQRRKTLVAAFWKQAELPF
jgi:hypothetical protein